MFEVITINMVTGNIYNRSAAMKKIDAKRFYKKLKSTVIVGVDGMPNKLVAIRRWSFLSF